MGSPDGFQSRGDDVVSSGASNVDDDAVGTSRLLLAGDSASENVKKSLYRFFSDPVRGAFSLNVLAEVFVKMVFFLVPALLFWRANKKEQALKDLEIQRKLDQLSDICKVVESIMLQGAGSSVKQRTTPSVLAPTPTAGSAAPPVPTAESSAPADSSSLQSSITPVPRTVNAGLSPTSRPGSNEPDTVAATSSRTVPTEPKSSLEGDRDQKGPRQQLRKRNGYIKSQSLNFPRTSSCESAASQAASESQAPKAEGGEGVPREHHVVNMQCTFPEDFPSKSPSMSPPERGIADTFKDMVWDKLGVLIGPDVASSRVMQARVPVTEESLGALRGLAVEGMKLDKGFTLQIGESFLYYCNGNPEEPVLLSLKDVEVPTILQVEYSAGMLIITGRYLEGAEIRAATSEGYMTFESIKKNPLNYKFPGEERIGVWKCTDLLPPVKLDRIQIFASKRVPIQGHSVTVRSGISSIQNTTLRTVIYKWVPTMIILNMLASQIWTFQRFINSTVDPLYQTFLSYATFVLMMYIIQSLKPSVEENIKDFMERLKLLISSFHVFPQPLDSPAFIMRNGYCFQRGAKYLLNSKPMIGGNVKESLTSTKKLVKNDLNNDGFQRGAKYISNSKSIVEGDVKEKNEKNVQESSTSTTKLVNNDLDNDETLEITSDWKWPCWKMTLGKLKRIDLDSEPIKSSNDSGPFEVIYGSVRELSRYYEYPRDHLPQDIVVRLHSKHLQEVVKEWLPNKLKLFENYGEIQAKDLLILYINGKLKTKENDLEAHFPSATELVNERNRLHMYHLVQFLEKEYEGVIREHKRMTEASMVSWGMLWTVIVPKMDVIYYCPTSMEELCGKVCNTTYKLIDQAPAGEVPGFQIELEVYDYNCSSFEAVRGTRHVLHFKGDVKILDLDVFPLKYKANPLEMEEYLFKRGRKFCDLVLKHEHQYLHYHGPMLNPCQGSYEPPRYNTLRRRGHGFKASVEGRVMIDQKWFAKLKPKWNMGTAQARELIRSNGHLKRNETRSTAMANGFDSVLKYSPAIVYGYSFSIRKWGCFTVKGFSKIQYISTAFDKLVMKEENKGTLLTLAEYYIKHAQDPDISKPYNDLSPNNLGTQIDLLPNKGVGCVIVLHGPPGTGKTLTVESLAEKLECPLWQLSISKLTASTKSLENKMLKTFEVAKSWGAILVLDEADVYLSSRKYSPLSGSGNTWNNAMVGVFLRVLEYYKGILFLTTNLMNNIEPAIFSRISLFIEYRDFTIQERKKLWNNFLHEINVSHVSEEFWKRVLPAPFNGRVIRNIIQNAQILIQSKKTATKTKEEYLLQAFGAMATPSTRVFLVESQELHQSSIEDAPSIPSNPTTSSLLLSDFPQVEDRD